MKAIYIIILILIIIATILAFIMLFYSSYKDKLESIITKTTKTKEDYYLELNHRLNILKEFIKLTEDKYKSQSKTFDKVKSLNSCEDEKLIKKCYKELIDIKESKQKNRELKAFKEIIKEYEESNLSIISLRTYNNKYVNKYHKIIKCFPYKYINKLKKYKDCEFLEGEEIIDDEEV